MTDFSSIQRCRDITDDVIVSALETRDDTRALLEHAATIAKPREAGARVLLVFAKLAGPECDWLDGALRVEIRPEGERSVIEVLADIGAGLKERVFPKITMDVPIVEFAAAIQKFPRALAPLQVEHSGRDRVTLRAGESARVERPEPALVVRVNTPKPPPPPAPEIPLPIVHAIKPVERRPLAKLNLRRTNTRNRAVAAEEVAPPKRIDPRASLPAPVPVVQPPKPPSEPPNAAPDDDVDGGWG